MPFTVDEKQVNGTLIRLFPYREHLGSGVTASLNISYVGDPAEPVTPLAPVLSGTMPTRTTATLTWVAADNSGRPVVTSWIVQRSRSDDDGLTFGAYTAITGSPFSAATRTAPDSGLAVGTPEVVWRYRARAVNADGFGAWSNEAALQWSSAPLGQPLASTGLTRGAFTADGVSGNQKVTLSWTESADTTVTKHGVFENTGTLARDGLDPTGTSYVMAGLVPGSVHNAVNIRRFNNWNGGTPAGWSGPSNTISFTVPPTPPTAFTMLMGCSASVNDHGGTEDWAGWRCYDESKMLNLANRTGAQGGGGNARPLFLAYSKNGGNFQGGYASTRAEVLADLNSFYYTTATGQTHSSRWGINLYWSNGNENSDKDILGGTPTAADIALWVDGQRGLYDAVHYIDPTTSARRFPDAYAGSNPTQNHEQQGIVARWLHPGARYHDFVMWSMYPPGRQSTPADPTYNYPVVLRSQESQRTNLQNGFLIRTYYRTFQAQAQARIDTGNPNFALSISCGEIGIGDDPGDSTTRPYYAVHALAAGSEKLAVEYGLVMDFTCWWDNQSDAGSPQNILTDEPGTTNPSTREAWQNWKQYNHQYGGTHPASWAGNPKAGWNTTGTVV